MRRCLVLVVLLAALSLSGGAQEKLTLTTPAFSSAGASEFKLAILELNRRSSVINAVFAEVTPGTSIFIPDGRQLSCGYQGATADAMLILLNKANLSANSLEKRVTTTCQGDGKLPPGTVTGTPQ